MLQSFATVGYQHCIYSYDCGECGSSWINSSVNWYTPLLASAGTCHNCGATNRFASDTIQPHIPSVLYIGHDRHNQLQIFPTPPNEIVSKILPVDSGKRPPAYFSYSTRSFISQASHELAGCKYICFHLGETLGEPVFTEYCGALDDEGDDIGGIPDHKCHILSGWSRVEYTCRFWDMLTALCQTDSEKTFLRQYFSLVKGRNFPMLIPQARIGIAERRRPDFVLYSPIQRFKYHWYAIELDGTHPTNDEDEQRNFDLLSHGYTVLSFRPGIKGYYEEVQRLVEKVEVDMSEADRDPNSATVVRDVHSYESATPL